MSNSYDKLMGNRAKPMTYGEYDMFDAKADQYRIDNEMVEMPGLDGVVTKMSGIDADTLMWQNPDHYGARAFGAAEDTDTANSRITMGMDENMQEVKYNIRWASHQNSVRSIFAHYELGEIETMAMFDQIAGEATREEERIRLGGREGVFGEQNIPGFSTGQVGMEQNIFQMAGDTISDAASAIGLYDNSVLGIAIRASGSDRMLAERVENMDSEAVRNRLLPEMIRAGKSLLGANDRVVQAAEAGDVDAIKQLHTRLAGERLQLGANDMGYLKNALALPEAQEWFAEARELGLDLNAAESELTGAFMIRKVQDLGMEGANKFINGKTPEERAEGLAGVAAASRVFGQDFFTEALAMQQEHGFTPEKGWAALDENRRNILEENGITFEVFMNGAENDAQAMVRNQASLIMLADREILQIVGHKMRTRAIDREYGEGSWFGSAMRFGGDMYRGMVDDPMAMFDMTIGGPLTGGAGAVRFTAAKVAGAGFWRSSGRFLVENAVMEGTMSAGSGLVSSIDAQLGNYQRGRTSVQFDSSLAAEDTAFTGAMGAGFSLALPLGLTGVAKTVGGIGKLGSNASRAGARMGMFGDDAKMRAEAYDIARTLNNDELEFALSHGSLPPEVAVRVQASSQAALDSANTFFQRHVENDGPVEASDGAAAMLNSAELDSIGMSRVEVVNFLFAVASDLGVDGKIGKAELDTLWKGYVAQREIATRGGSIAQAPGPVKRGPVSLEDLAAGKRGPEVEGPQPAAVVSRAERLQRAMAQRDAEAADNFATSARVTNDPSPTMRNKAENIMAKMMRGEDVKAEDVTDLVKIMTAVRDGRALDQFTKFLIDNNLKAYMSEDQIGRIVADLAEMKIAGRQAIAADPTLKRAIQLRAIMTNVANDLTTKSASGLGMTTRQIARFIDSYIGTAGNATARAKLLNDNPAGADIINKLWEEGSAKNLVVDEANASYDFAAFRKSEAYKKVRDLAARRKRIVAAYEGARNRFKRSAADLNEALNKIRKQEEKLRADYKALGVDDYDAKTALDRIEAETKTYENLTPIERRMLMSNALTRLVDRVDPELVSTTGASADRHMLKHMFEQTPIGDKIEAMFSRVALFPQSQARLFRSNIRLIRAGAQFIGNQHIGRRRYGGRSDLSSIEGVANAAMMETVAVRRLTRDMAAKLGPKVYQQFQSAVQQLRMRGLLVNDTPEARAALSKAITEQMPDLIKKYGGDADRMLDDVFAMNNQLTDYFQRVFENAKRNGSMDSNGMDPRKYVPHNLNSKLSATQRADFAKQMAAMKQKQYESEDSELALDALVELGWLERETTKSEIVMDDPNVSVQAINYTVPENSPFRGISGKTVEEDAAYVVKNAKRGRAFLTELQDKILTPEQPKPKTKGKKRPKAIGDDPVKPGTKTETTAPLMGPPPPKSADRGTASTGDVVRPVARTAEEDGAVEKAMDAIYNTNPEIEALERELAAITALDHERMTSSEILEALQRYDDIARELEFRVADAVYDADKMLDEAGSGETNFRSDLTAEDISNAIMDKSLYDAISPGHKALRMNYDSYVAQGVMTRAAADLSLAAFADLPADKVIGISIRNVDGEMSAGGTEYRYSLWSIAEDIRTKLENGTMTDKEAAEYLDRINEGVQTDRAQGAMVPSGTVDSDSSGRMYAGATVVLRELMLSDPFKEANLIVHELSHALFQNAPRELKLAVQALYSRELASISRGETSVIMDMLRNAGIRESKIKYGMSDIHEFTSMIAEVALNRNRSDAFEGMPSKTQNFVAKIMEKIAEAMRKMIPLAFQKDSFKLKAAVRQTEGLSEIQFKTLMDMTYSMAHGRNAMVRQAKVMDDVFGLEYNRGAYDPNNPDVQRSLESQGWSDTDERRSAAVGGLLNELIQKDPYKTAVARGNQVKDEKLRAKVAADVSRIDDGDIESLSIEEMQQVQDVLADDVGDAFEAMTNGDEAYPTVGEAKAKLFGSEANNAKFVKAMEEDYEGTIKRLEAEGFKDYDIEEMLMELRELNTAVSKGNEAKRIGKAIFAELGRRAETDAAAARATKTTTGAPVKLLSPVEGLTDAEKLQLEILRDAMRAGEELTGQQEQLVRELGDKAMAAEKPRTKKEAAQKERAEAKEAKNDWAEKLMELDEDMQVEILELYSGPLNGNIRDSTMANLIKNKGVHEVTTGGKAGSSTDVLALYRASRNKELPADERKTAKATLDRWVKKANISYAKQQEAMTRPTEAGAAEIAAREEGRVAARESEERQTPGVWVGAMKKDVDGVSVHGTWSGLRNAARAAGDEDLAIAIDRGLAMIELLEEFGDELFEAGLISTKPAPRLTKFVDKTINKEGKSNQQIADIRKIYTPSFWLGDKLTGKNSTLETREMLERIKNRAVQLGFGAGGKLGNFTVAKHVRQPAVIMEEMYGAVKELTDRGVMPTAEEAMPAPKPIKATETTMVKAADDANSTGEEGMIAPRSNIDKESLVKIAEAASDIEEYRQLVRAKYGDDAVDGEHFAIVDEYYNRLNPEVVDAKDSTLDTLGDDFFEGSKVVNKDGSPRIVYHGTTQGFDTFRAPADDEKVSTAIYAATRAENAEEYAGGDYGGGGDYFPTGANIRPVYMNIQNPYMLDVEGQNLTIGELKAMGYDGVVDAGGGYYAAFSPDQVRPVYSRDVPMADKSDAEVVEALEEMPPVEAETTILNMDGEQAKRVAAEAEAKQAEAEALADTELPVEDSGTAGGKPPKDPPKTAKGADGEGEEPKKKPTKKKKKPAKKKKGRTSQMKDEVLDRILGRKSSTEPVTPNHLNPKWKGNLLEQYDAEIGTGRAANERAQQYVQTQTTDMASSRINTSSGSDIDIAVKNSMNRLDNRMSREFSDVDMESPEGAELARLFGENSDIEEMIVNYGRGVGTRVKLADVMNELGGVKGYSIADLFAHIEEAGLAILETDAKTGKRNIQMTAAEAKAFRDYMNQLKAMYLKTLGYNVSQYDKNTALNRGLQIAQNLAYSRLGGTFVSSVIFTEGPINLLRTGGLGPAQLLKNGTALITGIAQIIGGVAARNIPGMSKFMSSLGLDGTRMRYIGEDIVMAMDGNNDNALAKFGLAETDESGHAGVYGVKQRIAAHGRRIKAAGGDSIEDDRFLGKLAARVDATTAASADLTGVGSGMGQVVNLVKSMAVSVGQNVLVRNGAGLVKMAAEMTDSMSPKELHALARKHGVPKQAAVFAAESGLLSDGGATLRLLETEMGIRFGKSGSRGRDLDLTTLQDIVNSRRNDRTYVEAGGLGLDDVQARQAEMDDKAVGQVQAFLTLFAQQGSPELKGSMRFTSGNPLASFLFAMTSYPMAAYQHLVANGVSAKGGAAAFGTLTALVALEYNNRLMQQMLYGKDEDTKKEALEKLQRIYSGDISTEDIVEVLALYGTQSPAFGAWGKYGKDLFGIPIATAAGVDTSGQFRANPFLGPVGGTVSNMYGKAIAPLTKMQSDDSAKAERSMGNLVSTAVDAGTPFNNALFQTISSNMTGKRVGDLMGEIASKSDGAARLGAPSASAEGFARGRSSRWYAQQRQPGNLADTPDYKKYANEAVPKPMAPVAAPATPQAAPAPPPAMPTPGSAGGSLADLLQQRKK